MDSVKNWKDYGKEAAAAENKRIREKADLHYKAASATHLSNISDQISEISDAIVEIRELLETLVGITKNKDREAYGQYQIQKAHELQANDG